jgi:hypothetical protein
MVGSGPNVKLDRYMLLLLKIVIIESNRVKSKVIYILELVT